ncbi:transposase [Streptomyces sp. NPDC058701]|uniref:transposase n=1 Tax=Streptomyces sp. NPDC058701 TaxID=3346608 RepID=UPI00364D464F
MRQGARPARSAYLRSGLLHVRADQRPLRPQLPAGVGSDLAFFATPDRLAAFAGLAPAPHDSGSPVRFATLRSLTGGSPGTFPRTRNSTSSKCFSTYSTSSSRNERRTPKRIDFSIGKPQRTTSMHERGQVRERRGRRPAIRR